MRMYEVRGGILLTISLFPMPTFNLARCHVAALVVVTGKGSPPSHSYIARFQKVKPSGAAPRPKDRIGQVSDANLHEVSL